MFTLIVECCGFHDPSLHLGRHAKLQRKLDIEVITYFLLRLGTGEVDGQVTSKCKFGIDVQLNEHFKLRFEAYKFLSNFVRRIIVPNEFVAMITISSFNFCLLLSQ